jgi:tellurite resistance protein TehA-like permease
MNVSPAFGVIGVLYALVTIVLAGLAVYALVLLIVFLRLRIAELKRAARPKDGPVSPGHCRQARSPHQG